jgi:FixJ family two-component response regulator
MANPIVCVVDDDESVRESLTGLLRSFGFDTYPFASGEDFLAASVRRRADCVILDVTMPGMSGAEVQERLLSEGPPPIIFITARIEDSLRARLLARGAVACLVKPFQEGDLLRALKVATRARSEK